MTTVPSTGGCVQPGGRVGLQVVRGLTGQVEQYDDGGERVIGGALDGLDLPAWPQPDGLTIHRLCRHGLPANGLPDEVNEWRLRNLPHLWRGARRVAAARVLRLPHFYGALWGRVIRGDGAVLELGLMSLRVVTTAGVNKVVAVMNTSDAVTGVNFKFHGFGTGGTAEASADTALVTELTTEYNPNNTRPTGTQTTGGSSNVYRSVGTLTPDSGSPAITEHGLFSANAAGTLFDRSLFAAVNLVSANGDSLQVTYDGTFAAGG